MMHKVLLGLALLATAAVAGITVDLQIRARMRTYDLAEARRDIVGLEEERGAVRVRVAAIWLPEAVDRAATSLRDLQRRWHIEREALIAAMEARALARL